MALDMSPVASGIQAAISWPSLHPLLSSSPLPFARDTGEEVCLEKNLSLTRHRFVAELRSLPGMRSISRMKLRAKVNF